MGSVFESQRCLAFWIFRTHLDSIEFRTFPVMAASVLSSLAISIALYALFDLGKNYVQSSVYGILSASILFLYTDLHTIALTVLTEESSAVYSFCFAPNYVALATQTNTKHLIYLDSIDRFSLSHSLCWLHLGPSPVLFRMVASIGTSLGKIRVSPLFLSFSPLVAWLLRNVNTYGQLHGARQPAKVSWGENTVLFWETVSTNIMASGLLFVRNMLHRTHSNVETGTEGKVLVEVGVYTVGDHCTSNLFNALQFEHGVARSH